MQRSGHKPDALQLVHANLKQDSKCSADDVQEMMKPLLGSIAYSAQLQMAPARQSSWQAPPNLDLSPAVKCPLCSAVLVG